MNVLMLSSSKAGNDAYLASAKDMIERHIGNAKKILFIPFAGVTLDWDSYTEKVQQALPEINVKGIHQSSSAIDAIREAEVIAVGGGNTFNLLNQLYQQNLIGEIQQRVKTGLPYIGWSAGSNICGNSIRTTNDMPIIEPPSFKALNLVPFQINPHYTDYQPPNHHGETRDQRIAEFCKLNPSMPVVAIREGTALLRQAQQLTLLGNLDGIVFRGSSNLRISPGQDLSDLLELDVQS